MKSPETPPDAAIQPGHWARFIEAAKLAGLNRVWVFSRETVDKAFSGRLGKPDTPSVLRPDYTNVVVMGSGGKAFWRAFAQWRDGLRDKGQDNVEVPGENPLDFFTERTVAALTEPLKAMDPGLVTAFPFRHAHRVIPFLALFSHGVIGRATPFGLTLDPEFGPWLGWRGVALTRLAIPETPLPTVFACDDCAGPCLAACPAGATNRQAFHWEGCARFRVKAPTCQNGCLARDACPVGGGHRYGETQMKHHYHASLAEIRRYFS